MSAAIEIPNYEYVLDLTRKLPPKQREKLAADVAAEPVKKEKEPDIL